QSERHILGLVFRQGALTQAKLVEDTELTQQSISRIINRLTDGGLLEPGQRMASGRRGYPSVTVKIAPGFTYALGVSIMTDAASIALTDFAGTVLHERKQAFTTMQMAKVVDWIEDSFHHIKAEHVPPGATFAGAGIG